MNTNKPPISFEFFPPKTDLGKEKLLVTHRDLSDYQPEFFSVTYGAGGSTQERTINMVLELNQRGISTAPHISCIGATEEKIKELLDHYLKAGINRLVALRGDLPSGMGATTGQFSYASDLVAYIKSHYGDAFHIEVAAYPEMHPQAPDFVADLRHFVNKANAGADSAITQYFFNPDSYFYFVDEIRKLGCDIDVVPGIMPITNYSNLVRFSDGCGADIPRWIRKKLESFHDDKAGIVEFGTEVVSKLCERLIQEGVPALHFYSMNQTQASSSILANLGYETKQPVRA